METFGIVNLYKWSISVQKDCGAKNAVFFVLTGEEQVVQ